MSVASAINVLAVDKSVADLSVLDHLARVTSVARPSSTTYRVFKKWTEIFYNVNTLTVVVFESECSWTIRQKTGSFRLSRSNASSNALIRSRLPSSNGVDSPMM